MKPWAVALCSVAVLAAAAAHAQGLPATRPATLPTRDVDVTYRSEPGGPQSGLAVEQRSRFSAAEQRTRLDMPTPGLFSIMDYRTHTLDIVSLPEKAVLETRGAPDPASQTFVRQGADVVAGLPCTEWQATDSVGRPALTCFTDDGVMLRVRRGTQVLAVAIRVAYAPQPADLFVIPPGFDVVQARTAPRPGR